MAKKGRVRGDQTASLNMVLGTSFGCLSEQKQEKFLKMAVLAAGVVAPTEMLLNLWETQVRCGVSWKYLLVCLMVGSRPVR